jgi:2-polyprenyl-3-methyl-5-hydroxy-6-metoxy-1,4-benzoquinol methylase
MTRVSGTEGYAEEAAALAAQYESISFDQAHASILHLIPSTPCRVVDIGAGTGRDAAGFAALGHRVMAVEPTDEMRIRAATLHPTPEIEWVNDSLPDLATVRRRAELFDVVMLNAVWMHLDERQRCRAMPNVASLIRPGGMMSLSLRYGPIPPGRRMFAVPAEEVIRLAQQEGLELTLRRSHLDSTLRRPGVSWTRLAFARPAIAAL